MADVAVKPGDRASARALRNSVSVKAVGAVLWTWNVANLLAYSAAYRRYVDARTHRQFRPIPHIERLVYSGAITG